MPSSIFNMFDINKENGDFNQYWYSTKTIEKIVEEVSNVNGRIAFLSTPSLYFSLPPSVREQSYLFEYDRQWESDPHFVFFDFHETEKIPVNLKDTFDLLVIDPPFITEDVWRLYAASAHYLLKKGQDPVSGLPLGKVILTTVIENEPLLEELFQARATRFRPSIPHLVYQYSLFTNYPSEVFNKINPEID
eukprot:gene9257-10218_t